MTWHRTYAARPLGRASHHRAVRLELVTIAEPAGHRCAERHEDQEWGDRQEPTAAILNALGGSGDLCGLAERDACQGYEVVLGDALHRHGSAWVRSGVRGGTGIDVTVDQPQPVVTPVQPRH